MRADRINKTISALIVEELSSGGSFLLRVLNSSMSPFISPNDEIMVKKVLVEHLTAGDIVVFRRHFEVYVHRLLSKKTINSRLELITKGDNSFIVDAPVSEEEFLGKAVVVIKKDSGPVDLECGLRRAANRLISLFSYLEAAGYNYLRRFKKWGRPPF